MNCYLHPETTATAFCRSCGRPLCNLCQRPVADTVFCPDHAPATAYDSAPHPNAGVGANPYFEAAPAYAAAGPKVQTSPVLAFILGFIPGVGAIYNGQYIKGLIHAVIFGLIVSLISSANDTPGEPFLGILLCAYIFYMAFEAYHTARKRQMGLPVEEWSSLINPSRTAHRAPVGPIVLIGIGVLFLLDTLHLIEFRAIGRFWPVILIVMGAYMLYNRIASVPPTAASAPYPPTPPPPGTPSSSFVETGREQ
jgi:TM2 domain-containing membrane protein YozV